MPWIGVAFYNLLPRRYKAWGRIAALRCIRVSLLQLRVINPREGVFNRADVLGIRRMSHQVLWVPQAFGELHEHRSGKRSTNAVSA